jgi:hypothetical protein
MLHPARVERRSPATLVVLRQLQVEALAVHPDGDVADAGPGVERGAEPVQRAIVGGLREPREAECCSQELAAWVEHGLLDDLIGPQQECLRDREPQRLRGLQVDDQLELGRLLDGKVGRLGALEDSVNVVGPSPE